MKRFRLIGALGLLSCTLYAMPNKINLNQANATTLAHSFRGIGDRRAEAIVKYRETHGPFRSILDLGAVKGIGHRFVKRQLSQLQGTYTVD